MLDKARNVQVAPKSTAGSKSGYDFTTRADQRTAAQDKGTAPEDTEAALGLDDSQWTQIQQSLIALDYDPGPVDGIAGDLTRQGLREFQHDLKAPETGYLNQQQLAVLLDKARGTRDRTRMLKEGDAALARGDYAAAVAAARAMNGNAEHNDDAQLPLARALYGQRQYAQSAKAFGDLYNGAPKGLHAADALLGWAETLTAVNDKVTACQMLARLDTEFPATGANLSDAIASARQSAACNR